MSIEEIRSILTPILLEAGAKPSQFSIGSVQNNCMCLVPEDGGWKVFYDTFGEAYSPKFYTDLSQAVYEFCTRIVSTEYARQAAARF